uniref:Tc1-like transposase DDE domain-containing protein n=1 Tax=Neolamprologus brichardi TaxID=32507 RepID=A0A3Q4I3X5_NEOBR
MKAITGADCTTITIKWHLRLKRGGHNDWGDAFSFSGTMKLQEVQGCQKAAGCVQMLQRASLMTQGPHLCGNDWVFQQDNATVHNARRTKDFFQENNITLLDHPASSPDLNPTENGQHVQTSAVQLCSIFQHSRHIVPFSESLLSP